MPRFGELSREYVERAIDASYTRVLVGIQSQEGRAEKEVPPDAPPAGGVNLATVAEAHEFGTVTIPQRSFLRSTGDAEGKKWLRAFGAAIRAYAEGSGRGFERRIRVLGNVAVSDVRNTIRRRIAPPLAAVTVARRRKGRGSGEDVPLIDTGQLVNSIRSAATDSPDGDLVIG